MKKLLMEWFPKYFTINNTFLIDTRDLEGGNNKFKVFHVDPGNEHMHEGLGMTDEQVKFFSTEIKRAILDSENTIDAMAKMTPHIKHANEFYMVSIMLYTEVQRMHSGNGGGGLLEALMRAHRGGPDKD